MTAGTFNVGESLGVDLDSDHASQSACWVIAVIRLGVPLSFSRKKMASVTKDVSLGGMTRASAPLVITDDCLNLSVSNSKRSHLKNMNATLKQTDVNYLVEILPGDHVMSWIVGDEERHLSLLSRLEKGEPCNNFDDGLKFVGRVHSVRKQVRVSRESGIKTAQYNLQCVGFSELESILYYDNSLASKDLLEKSSIGSWLVRLGVEYERLFRDDATNGIKQNNINQIAPTLLDLLVGKGPDKAGAILVDAANGQTATATPSLDTSAPFSYLIPLQVGKILGVEAGSKADRVMAYADILELVQGIQKYPFKSGYQVFVPSLKEGGTARRRVTPHDMLGTFLPFFPDLCSVPLWQVLNRYLNPAVNELFTSLRVSPDGKIMPTITMRQIPFTTEAFDPKGIQVTRFVSDMPRWKIPAVMVYDVDIGRSDATRFNFVHVYGQSSYAANNNPIAFQIVENPPIRDDLDIQRSGLRPYQSSIEVWIDDQIGKAPGVWMNLISDWTIGSHLTLNGTITTLGIQAPIAEGDNLEFDGVVYHIEGVTHQAGIDGSGHKTWTTTLQLTNGMRADGGTDEEKEAAKIAPLYPGFKHEDNKGFDPGLSLEHTLTTGGLAERRTDYDDNGLPTEPPPFVPKE